MIVFREGQAINPRTLSRGLFDNKASFNIDTGAAWHVRPERHLFLGDFGRLVKVAACLIDGSAASEVVSAGCLWGILAQPTWVGHGKPLEWRTTSPDAPHTAVAIFIDNGNSQSGPGRLWVSEPGVDSQEFLKAVLNILHASA